MTQDDDSERVPLSLYTIDRFEGSDWAVLEDEQARTFNIPRQWLPADSRESDLVTVSEVLAADARLLRFALDPCGREERLKQTRETRERLPRGPKGDVSL
jgi:hypothetical protein